MILLLLKPFSCRECLLGPEDNCPELTEEYVRVTSPGGTGYTGWMTAYGFYEDCPSFNLQTRPLQNDSGVSPITLAYAYMGTDSIRIHLERTKGNDPIVIWSRIGQQYDTLSPGVLVYDATRVR